MVVRVSSRRRRERAAWALVLTLTIGGASLARAADDATRATMRRVFEALSTLLPIALTDSYDQVETGREDVRDAVDQLADAAGDLAVHASAGDTPFDFLSESLAFDARAIRARVAAGRYADAAYRTERMTQTCVACHARLPSEEGPAFAQRLIQDIDLSPLAPEQAARLEVATRQFDRAMDRYEKLLADPQQPAAALDHTGALADYLVVALRVRGNPERARKALEGLAARGDLTGNLERALPVWIRSLRQLAPELAAEPSLARARSVLEKGASLGTYRSDRSDLIHRIVASSLLYRLLEREDVSTPARAEALLLLGESDAFVRRSFERSEAQFYLEQAIRLAPGTALAEEAYARLEEETLLGYTGSSGVNLPPDVERRLTELRQLARGGGAHSDG